ncbi:MAG: hypothetical protein JWO73_479 [Candidatus Taylorbacteria bacterium]|nr:hypothetical protein [Candidatus Taylorbacteria bacterium]
MQQQPHEKTMMDQFIEYNDGLEALCRPKVPLYEFLRIMEASRMAEAKKQATPPKAASVRLTEPLKPKPRKKPRTEIGWWQEFQQRQEAREDSRQPRFA